MKYLIILIAGTIITIVGNGANGLVHNFPIGTEGKVVKSYSDIIGTYYRIEATIEGKPLVQTVDATNIKEKK